MLILGAIDEVPSAGHMSLVCWNYATFYYRPKLRSLHLTFAQSSGLMSHLHLQNQQQFP